MKERIRTEVLNYFSDYYDQNLINKDFDDFYDIVEIISRLQEINKELYMVMTLEYSIYLDIINRVKEEDIESELYLIEKLRFVYDLFLRRTGFEPDERKYEKALKKVMNVYNGYCSITALLYKKLTIIYSNDKSKKKLL